MRKVLALVAIMTLVGCFGGDNVMGGDSVVKCWSGGKLVAQYHVTGIVFRGKAGYSFDVDGRAVNVNADCIVEEQR